MWTGCSTQDTSYPMGGCCCANCIADREKLGMDSTSPDVRVKHSQIVMDRAMTRLAPIVQNKKPGLRLFFNGPIGYIECPSSARF